MVEVSVEYGYEAEQPDELSIKPGEIIKNVIMVEGGWWEGELNGKKGMFPDNFVKVVKNPAEVEKRDDSKKKQVQASKRQSVRDLANKLKDSVHEGPPVMRKRESGGKKKRAKVVFSYDPENEDELQLAIGDMIEVLKQEEEGWWEGIVNGKQGVFPSNFVEILEETTEPVESGEKPATPGGEENIIKGKKIHGVGLGNIFGGGPIKLRSTTGGVKAGDKPQEPPKTEKRSEESVMRRQKDASACPTNPAKPNPGPVADPMSQYRVVRSDEVYEIVHRDDRHNLNNSGEVVEPERHAMFYIESSNDLKEDGSLDTQENLEDYNDTDLTYSDIAYIDQDTVDITNVSEVSQDYSYGNFEVEQNTHVGRNTVNKPALDEENNELGQCEDSEYTEHLQVILDDLDSCLDQSCSEGDNLNHSEEEGTNAVDENDESLLACIVESRDCDSPDIPTGTCLGDVSSTPIHSLNFSQAIDSVFVTKKRYVSASRLDTDQTPTRAGDEDEQGTEASKIDIEVPTPLYLSGATKHPQATYLSSLNSTGHLSPFMRSIANKYKLFDPSKPKFKEIDVDVTTDPDDNDTSYASYMMEHTLDAQIPTVENGSDQGEEAEQTEVDDMVRNYVYDVLAGSTKGKESTASFETELTDSDLDMYRKEPRHEDDGSMMVCVDEYSVRFMDTGSKDNLVTDHDDETEDDTDSLSSEGGVLLCMTEGSDSSPPLSCCSASLYPRFDHLAPAPDNPDQPVMYEKFKSKLVLERSVRSAHDSPETLSSFKDSIFQADPDCGPFRATSSYCRIPFKNDAPSFWFKKDFNESPCRRQVLSNPAKARSPKRTISEISDSFPTLFALAEKVFLDEFKLKIEAFKSENLQLVLEEKSPFFFSDRSPARKKRRRIQANIHCQRLSPKLALNFNSNALTYPDEPCIQIDPETPGSVDAYFAEKIESSTEIIQQVLPSPAQMDLQSVTCCSITEPQRIDWSESLFNKRSFRKKSRNTRRVWIQNVKPQTIAGDTDHDIELETNSKGKLTCDSEITCRPPAVCSDTDDSLDNLINDCSEKRRKRRFTPRSKSDLHHNPVQLIGYKKFDTSDTELTKTKPKYAIASKAKSASSFSTDKTVNVVDLILKQDSSIFVSPSRLKKKSDTFPKHKIQDIMYEMASEDTNDVLSYFDHGDEPIDVKQGTELPDITDDNMETENHRIDETISLLQEAVEEHFEMANMEPSGLPQVIKMLDTRDKLYEAISEAVSFCAGEIEKDLNAQGGVSQLENELDETVESATKPDKSYDLTPDTEALEKDLNAIDLSGTPAYANAEGTDKEMKAFLNEAMESFDNILIQSFASSTEFSESDEYSVSHESEKELLDDAEDSQELSDTCGVDFVEIDDDSVLAVVGRPCILHERENETDEFCSEKILCPEQGDATVEVEEDSILNVVGKKCYIHIRDGNIPPLKDLCCKIVQQLAKQSTTTVRFRDVTNSDYDEAYEVEDRTENDEQKSPDCVRTPGNLYSPIPGFFCTRSTLEHGLEIGIPDYESSPLFKMDYNKGNAEYYNTEEMLVDGEDFLYPEDPTETRVIKAADNIRLSVHNNSPVEFADGLAEKADKDLQDVNVSTSKDNPFVKLEAIRELTEGDVEIDISDDSRWMEEHMTASRSRTPADDGGDLVMSECPTEFDEKLSSYPSPKI